MDEKHTKRLGLEKTLLQKVERRIKGLL